ncbi:MAG: hypothetical protein ABIQ16_10135 [Polyangiaceae bacterium]
MSVVNLDELGSPSARGRPFRDRFPRPNFMTLTVVAALLVTPSVGLLAAELRDPAAEHAQLAREADEALRGDLFEHGIAQFASAGAPTRALAALGVEVVVPERTFHLESGRAVLTGNPVATADAERALETLAVELARYPASFLERARLHRLLLCSKLHEGTEAIPSLPNFHGTLLVDVNADAPFLRRLLHHEVFHFADYADDDQLSHDPAWLALNDHYFVYGSGGRFVRDRGAGRFSAELPGFVSRYATSALEEDKAETFAMRMVAPRTFAALVAEDPILLAKSAAVEAQLHRLSPALDARFFEGIDLR